MKKSKTCEKCKIAEIELFCDECKAQIKHSPAVEVIHNYGSPYDMLEDDWGFCSYNCFVKYCAKLKEE